MDIFCWNVRGINDPVKRRGFRKWIRKYNPIFGCLVESHVQQPNSVPVVNILPNWSFDDNYDFSDLGKIWVVWKPSVQVKIIAKTLQMITCSVKLPFQTSEFVVSFIYPSNCRRERRLLWSELESTYCLPQLCSLPWIVMGDFNEIISPSEHSSADHSTSTRGMCDFRERLQQCSLSDLQYSGNTFTWSNSSVSKKLDRVVYNEEWLESFPESIAVFGKPGISDHSPCCTFLDQFKPPQKRPFQEMKPFIRAFNKENYSEIKKPVQEAFDHLTDCQQVSLSAPSSLVADAERSSHARWYGLAKAEDKFLRQRSRVQWSVDGDEGTAFFHRANRARQSQNHIHFLLGDDGRVIDSLEGVKSHAVNNFQNLLGGANASTTSTPDDIASIMQVRCSAEAITSLAAPFTVLDIEKAFLSLPKNKSPGPDGYPAELFTGNWKVVGRNLIAAVKEFLSTGELLQQWNATLLILVPKKTNANKITEFRPIACCNTVYKVASKLLANRLKDHLPTLISSSQSAFVPGRLLVDLQNAFDTLDWNFVLYTLEALEFPLVFSQQLKRKFQDGSIGFHPNTSSLQVTHLSFADDLMIFTDGTPNSVKCIADTMEDFAL
ncbi:PREDICTED: uncharacterized protein LOC106323632 [Brassica oleracea var. oleracea]|uniref:uncharacterized protein LOC106323632 n=1 Tax=Brassica oleracea var. oleracea TaxID=109376 RepID=UPI0006A75800|nr:PREDICTED: uncharacterized protein LOC106323632 [Brassica oleracea var. oleracea]